ncbi:STAS domain-containing protein [Actinomadura sp. GTD37]|uniref:STAS domain-containing protein n=1 Tax=Actinomadura sp. GTD37 TaxID=1778030 RepID=UPI0035C04C29
MAADMVVVEGDRHTTVMLSGEMDRAACPAVQRRLRELPHRPLLLDFSGVSFIDVDGLRMVHECARGCKAEGTALALVGVSPFTARLFRILGLDELIPLCRSTEEALWCLFPRTDDEIRDWLTG